MQNLYDLIENVQDKDSFLEFSKALRLELKNDPEKNGWENITLEAFLEASSAWLKDSQKEFPENKWKLLAQFLLIGKIYE